MAPVLSLVGRRGGHHSRETLHYRLYRVASPEGEPIQSTAGLTPIQDRIPSQGIAGELIALDRQPSETEHSYFVTAVDEAGNESVPSATAYLNMGLLPVSQLRIHLPEQGNPQLTWHYQGTGIAGFNVYDTDLMNSEQPQPLNMSLLPFDTRETQFIDPRAFSATAHRRYTVTAVDHHGVESIGHSMTLPALSLHKITPTSADERTIEHTLKRGVMNELLFRVENRGSGTGGWFTFTGDHDGTGYHKTASICAF